MHIPPQQKLSLLLLIALMLSALPAVAQPSTPTEAAPSDPTTFQATAEPREDSFEQGQAVGVTGTVRDDAGQPAADVVTAALIAADGQVLAGPIDVAVSPDGTYEVTFDPAATSGLQIDQASDFRQVVAVVIEGVPADAPAGTPPTRLAIQPVLVTEAPDGLVVTNSFVSSVGWVKPGASYSATVTVANYSTEEQPDASVLIPPTDGMTFTDATTLDGGSASIISGTVSWSTGPIEGATVDGAELTPATRRLVVTAVADTHEQDPQIVWKNLSTTATLTNSDGAFSESTSHGPKVVPQSDAFNSARYGDRPFPVVPVEFYDFRHQPANSGEDLATRHQRSGVRGLDVQPVPGDELRPAVPQRHGPVVSDRHGRVPRRGHPLPRP